MALLDNVKNLFSTVDEQGEPKDSILKKPVVIISLVVLFLIICLFIIHYFFLGPKITALQKKVSKQKTFIKEIDEAEPVMLGLLKKIDELTNERNTTAKLFVSDQEVEEIYQLISFSALKNKLVLSNLNRGKEEVIYQDESNSIVDFIKLYVKFSIEGNFGTYMALRKEIAGLDKNVFFELEKIIRNEDGSVKADVELSLVKMPD